jgi:membrane protease subunit (stomatin/prohibitin family)
MKSLHIISEEFSAETLVARNKVEDFTSGSQLIVHETQEALFFKNGQALDLFGPGRHTLTTANMPLLSRIFGKLFGGNTPFPCEVYYINKVNVLDLQWGTDAPIVIEDPKYHIIVNVRAYGQTGVRVSDSRRLVLKLVGQLADYDVQTVKRAIKGMMVSSVKESISQAIVEEGISILDITSHLSRLEEKILAKVNARIETFGIMLLGFSIGGINGDPEDLVKLRQVKEKRLEARSRSEDELYDMSIKGYTYHEQRKYDVLEEAAKNNGGASGGFMGLGIGLGMGAGVGREVGNMMNYGMAAQPSTPAVQSKVCPNCQTAAPADAKFCQNCGNKFVAPTPKFCPQCGSACPEGSRFCPSCGHNLIGG